MKRKYNLKVIKYFLVICLMFNLSLVFTSCDVEKTQGTDESNPSENVDKTEKDNSNSPDKDDNSEQKIADKDNDVKKWRDDLEQLKHDLTWFNSAPFERYGEVAFNKLYDKLYDDIPNLNDFEREYRFRELLYSIGDGHTDMWTDSEYETALPIMIDEIENGYYIINASLKYEEMIGKKIETINGVNIDEIVEKLEKISNGESEYWRRAGAIDKLQLGYFYKLLGIENSDGDVVLINDTEVKLLPMMLYISTNWSRDLKIGNMTNSMAKGYYIYERPYDYEFLEDNKILRIMFSSCNDEIEGYPLHDFGADVLEDALNYKPEILLLDLRDNGGGSPSAMYAAFSEKFFKETGFMNSPKFFIATNNSTFSAGVTTTHLVKSKFGATHIGTPTGGSPFTTNVSETANKVLLNTGINFRISSAKVKQKMIETPSELPDILVEKTLDDLKNDKDPIIEFVKSQL